ncbi:unnamed protein product [Caenorhabditis sp. 36 PRJEB53466]|nr:unnamed protein product [Caenorhabditis sp. 36 PRJEB53466]
MTDVPSTSDTNDLLPDIDILGEPNINLLKTKKKTYSDKNVIPDECRICKNPAVGYHYDVASCNGCKAFFRRTVITGRRYQCSNGNKCLEREEPIAANKRVCGACRFAKCEEMGMNPMAIQAEISSEGKLMKEELLRKRNADGMPVVRLNVTDELSTMIAKLTIAESQIEKLHTVNLPENYRDFRSLSDILVMHPIFDVSKIPNMSFLMNQTFPVYAGFAHNSFLSVVEYTKLLDFFPQIELESIRKLIGHGSLICRNMIMSFDSLRRFNSDTIRRQDGTIAGKPLRNYNGVWVEHRKIIQKTLHAFMRNDLDSVEYMLLKAIVICNPAVAGLPVKDQKTIEHHRLGYAQSLLTYCLKQHGQRHGPNRLASLLSMISIMELQQREEKGVYIVFRAFYRSAAVLVSPFGTIGLTVSLMMEVNEWASTSWQPATESKHTISKTFKSLPKNKSPSTCLVCRNRAVGYHYDVGMNPMAINFEVKTDGAQTLMDQIMNRRANKGFVASAGVTTQEDKINKIINKLSIVECKIDKVHTDGIPKGFEDCRRLEDILKAKAIFNNRDIPNLVKSTDKPSTVHYAHCSFLASLEYSKTFDFSKKLDLEDKIILVKHVTAACSNMITAFFTISNFRSERLMFPDGTEVGANMGKLHKMLNLRDDVPHRTLAMLLRNRTDRVEYMLLKAIVMCNPAVMSLSERSQNILDGERQSYAFCLLRYCQIQHGALNGPARFAGLLSLIPSMEIEVKNLKDFHLYIKAILVTDRIRAVLPSGMKVTNLFDDILDS